MAFVQAYNCTVITGQCVKSPIDASSKVPESQHQSIFNSGNTNNNYNINSVKLTADLYQMLQEDKAFTLL